MSIERIKSLLFGVLAAYLIGGYIMSQYFVFSGKAAEWTKIIDVPSVQMLSMVLFLAVIVLWAIPTDKHGAEK